MKFHEIPFPNLKFICIRSLLSLLEYFLKRKMYNEIRSAQNPTNPNPKLTVERFGKIVFSNGDIIYPLVE